MFSDAVRAIGEPPFVRFLISADGTSMVMAPFDKKEFQSVRVPKDVYQKTGTMDFRSVGLCRFLAYRFGWDRTCSYRLPGRVLPKQGLVRFDLTCAVQIKGTDNDGGADKILIMDHQEEAVPVLERSSNQGG